jgi:hypothetical protein
MTYAGSLILDIQDWLAISNPQPILQVTWDETLGNALKSKGVS